MCSTLDEVKLKEKGRAFHDLFLTKVSTHSGGGILFIYFLISANFINNSVRRS
jgi:hypothetical protein